MYQRLHRTVAILIARACAKHYGATTAGLSVAKILCAEDTSLSPKYIVLLGRK